MPKKDYYAPILKNWIYPHAQQILGRNFSKTMKAALYDQHLSRDELKTLQFKKLIALIQHTCKYVPYYRDTFKEIGLDKGDVKTWEDFREIPILTKDVLRENEKRMISLHPSSRLNAVKTSGSTGVPLKIWISQQAALRANVSRIRSLKWWGIELGDREIRLSNVGVSFEQGWKASFNELVANPLRNQLMNRKQGSAYTMTNKSMQAHWEAMLEFSPKYLFGFPSAYTIFANFLQETGIDGRDAGLKLVLTYGEILHEWQEETITQTFGCPVANEYGSVEAGVIAYSQPCGAMHTMDDGVIVEVIKENPEDEFGSVVVTNLDNWDFPIIRYNLDDLAKAVHFGHECSLGINLGILEELFGRDQDVLRLASGRIVYNPYFHNLIKYVRGVKQYQLIQKKADQFELDIVAEDETVIYEQESAIQEMVREHLEDSTIVIKVVDNIPKDPSGKLRFVKSEM